jgi:hypothetical protein
MPQIIVAADRGAAFGEGAVTFRERVNVADFESGHFAAQLVERLGWAVEDADVVEHSQQEPGETGAMRAPQLNQDDQDDRHEQNEPVESRREDPVALHAPA